MSTLILLSSLFYKSLEFTTIHRSILISKHLFRCQEERIFFIINQSLLLQTLSIFNDQWTQISHHRYHHILRMLTIHHQTLCHWQLTLHSPTIKPIQLLQHTLRRFFTLTTSSFFILVSCWIQIPSHRQNQHRTILISRGCHIQFHRSTTTKSFHEHFPFFRKTVTGLIFRRSTLRNERTNTIIVLWIDQLLYLNMNTLIWLSQLV